MRQKTRNILSAVIGAASVFALTGSLPAQQANLVPIGQQFGAAWSRTPVSAAQMTKKLRAWTENGGFSYVVVYRFPAEAGSRYTLVLTYPGDKSRRRIIITGENPYSDEAIRLPQGKLTSFPMDLTTHPAPPGASSCTETRRINFTVDPQSDTRGLFLVCLARELPAPLDFILKFPAVPDAEVKAYTVMPNCSWLGKIYWGKIVDYPIFMAGSAPAGPKTVNKDARAEMKAFSGTPMQVGGDFEVPPGFRAINFRAANQVNFPNRSWKIVRLLPNNRTADVYRYAVDKDLRTGRMVEVEDPVPLKKLVLGADRYRIIISGSTGSSLHLYFELVPLRGGAS